MVEIRIYVEGGGDQRNGKDKIRLGFSQFFRRAIGKNLHVIACGGRNVAYDNFVIALTAHPNAFNILLVDSEAPVAENDSPWTHLKKRDDWNKPTSVGDDHCHLLVQAMEAWLIADRDTLRNFYGQGFNINAIPNRTNVEEILKDDLEPALITASKKTKTKGKYHKINHAPDILSKINPQKVRQASQYCDRLLTKLAEILT